MCKAPRAAYPAHRIVSIIAAFFGLVPTVFADSALFDLTPWQLAATAAIFVWSGFVRAGLGFGGAVLTLPLLLMVDGDPLFWLPIISMHLILFSAITLRSRMGHVDWQALRRSLPWVLPGKLIGVFGLLSLPNRWLVLIVYSITAFYAIQWIIGLRIRSRSRWSDCLLLFGGGYFSGTSLSGSPLIVSVYAHQVERNSLRNTLFVLWILLVSIKLAAFAWFDIDLQWLGMLLLFPVAAIGHLLGMRAHDYLLDRARLFKIVIGTAMAVIAAMGFLRVL